MGPMTNDAERELSPASPSLSTALPFPQLVAATLRRDLTFFPYGYPPPAALTNLPVLRCTRFLLLHPLLFPPARQN